MVQACWEADIARYVDPDCFIFIGESRDFRLINNVVGKISTPGYETSTTWYFGQ